MCTPDSDCICFNKRKYLSKNSDMQSLKEYHRNERIKIEKCNILLWNVAFCLALHISADHGKTLVFFIKIANALFLYHYSNYKSRMS